MLRFTHGGRRFAQYAKVYTMGEDSKMKYGHIKIFAPIYL